MHELIEWVTEGEREHFRPFVAEVDGERWAFAVCRRAFVAKRTEEAPGVAPEFLRTLADLLRFGGLAGATTVRDLRALGGELPPAPKCSVCEGDGRETCEDCEGRGARDQRKCRECEGSGRVECLSCAGSGERGIAPEPCVRIADLVIEARLLRAALSEVPDEPVAVRRGDALDPVVVVGSTWRAIIMPTITRSTDPPPLATLDLRLPAGAFRSIAGDTCADAR